MNPDWAGIQAELVVDPATMKQLVTPNTVCSPQACATHSMVEVQKAPADNETMLQGTAKQWGVVTSYVRIRTTEEVLDMMNSFDLSCAS